MEHFAEIRPWRRHALLDVKITAAAVKERINEINEIRKVIETILFPCDDRFIARIISDFTDGLENLKEFNRVSIFFKSQGNSNRYRYF